MDTDTFGNPIVKPHDAVKVLNSAVLSDSEAMNALVETRVPCNDALADHPTIQVLADDDGSNARVGLLGILNGIFGTMDNGRGFIEAVCDDDGKLKGFRVGSIVDESDTPERP